jgi:hypothetical protein
VERRRKPRRIPAAGDPLAQVRLRTGPELSVIDVGDWGGLVEGSVRLLPGSRLDVHLIAAHGRVLVRCRVTRAFVVSLGATVILYRGALAFDQAIDTRPRGYPLPGTPAVVSGGPGSSYPPAGIEPESAF